MSGERDPFEAFKEACMDALSKLPDVTAARLKVAYRLLRHGNRNWFRKEQRFLTWPSRATLAEAHGTGGGCGEGLLVVYSAALEVQSGTANNKQFSRRWTGPPPLKREQRPWDRTAHSGNRLGYGAVLIPTQSSGKLSIVCALVGIDRLRRLAVTSARVTQSFGWRIGQTSSRSGDVNRQKRRAKAKLRKRFDRDYAIRRAYEFIGLSDDPTLVGGELILPTGQRLYTHATDARTVTGRSPARGRA